MPGQSEDSYITIAECPQKYSRSVDDYLNPKWFNCLKHIAGYRQVSCALSDRGKEFSDAEGLQEALGAPVCFCRPHHPWERGTDESTNGLLGGWLPKGESLDDVSDSEVQEACDSLNRRPRKRLKWKCPWEVYHHQSLHLL